MELLAGKRIALGVSASISVYKAPEIVRALQKQGAIVRVVMSEESTRFLSPLIFEALTKMPVLHALSESWSNGNDHIALASWAELFLIAPATANTINKIAQGIADNLLLSSFLAFRGKKLLAPAANTNMFQNPLTQESLQKLIALGVEIIPTVCKELACGIVGEGALQEPSEIVEWVVRAFYREAFWQGRSVAVSGGGSIEAIDSVRFLSNRSSGKMASALSRVLFYKGAEVMLISSKMLPNMPKGIHTIPAESARNYLHLLSLWQDSHKDEEKTPFIYMAAAISDYESEEIKGGKLKKDQIGESWSPKFIKTPDVLQSLNKDGFKVVGFKLENKGDSALGNAQRALRNKHVDAICLNTIHKENNPMESEENEVIFITRDSVERFSQKGKFELAFEIVQASKQL